MKNKPKRLHSREPRARGRLGKALLHLLRLAGLALFLSVLLVLFHLLTIGVPTPLTQKITDQLRKSGIPVQIDSISLSPHRGWVLHNVCVYSPNPDDLSPLLQTDKLYLHIWPEDWTPISRTEWRLNVYCKKAAVSLGLPWEKKLDEAHPFRTVSRLHARLRIDPSCLTVDRSEMNWGGYILHSAGKVRFPDRKHPPDPASYEKFQTYMIQAADLLASLTFDMPPEIRLHFDLPAGRSKPPRLDVTFLASGLRRQGQFYERIAGAAHLRDGEATLDALRVTSKNSGQLFLSGRYNHSARTAQLEVENSLPADELLGLMPERAAAKIAGYGTQPFGTVNFDASLGPCPPQELAEHLRVQMHSLQIRYEDLTFDPLQFDLVREGNRLKTENIQARSGESSLSAALEMDLVSGAWNASAQGRVPTAPIGTRLKSGAQKWVHRIEFTNHLPLVQVELSKGAQKGSFRMKSSVNGQDVLCAGIPMDSLDITMTYSNRVFSLSRLEAARGNQTFSGTVKIDLDRKHAFFNADSGFNPVEIAQIIAPDHPTILTNFTFSGPLVSSAAGRIDYSGGTDHAAQGSIRATNVSASGLTADSFSSRVEARGSHLIFSNTTMNIFNGFAEGSAVFDLQFNDAVAPYQLDINAIEMDLAAILSCFSSKDQGKTSGCLSASVDLTADAKAGFWASVNGTGQAEIEKGQLRDLPVLGGFSRLVRTTLPGFSLFSLTSFYSEYELRDGALLSDNTQLGGTLFSARARGKYSPGKGLDFTVRAEPLRQTRTDKEWYQIQLWAADALKKGTAPLFDLLEFRLEGPLQEPVWRMKALPKGAYDLFGKLSPSSAK